MDGSCTGRSLRGRDQMALGLVMEGGRRKRHLGYRHLIAMVSRRAWRTP